MLCGIIIADRLGKRIELLEGDGGLEAPSDSYPGGITPPSPESYPIGKLQLVDHPTLH